MAVSSWMWGKRLTFTVRATIIDVPCKGGPEAVILRFISARRQHIALPVILAGLFLHISASDALERTSPTTVDGSLSLRYTFRTAELATDERIQDQDVFTDLRLDVTRSNSRPYEFHFLGSLRSDLDGDHNVKTFFPFEDINNTHKGRTTGTVYEAYAVLKNDTRPDTRARVGRQAGTRDEAVYFDGIAADIGMAGGRANLTLYGGIAVSFYEVDGHWGDDALEGVGIDFRPLASTGISADYLVVSDRPGELPAAALEHDRMTAFKIWHRFAPASRVSAAYRFLDGDPRDMTLTAVTVLPLGDLELTGNYYRQIQERDERSSEVAPFTTVLGVSAPFHSVDLKARKYLGDQAVLDAGYFKRELLDSADTGPFNKEYSRSYGAMELLDLFVAGLSWSITGERWQTDGTETASAGTDLAYRFKAKGRDGRAGIGTYYSLFKYDSYAALGVREKVRTYYIEGKVAVVRTLSVNGRYEFERGIEQYQTLRLGMRYDF